MFFERYINPENLLRDRGDFIKRSYGIPPLFIFSLYLSAFALVAGAAFLSNTPTTILTVTGIMLLVLALAHIYLHFYKNAIIAGTEFQNTVFASAARSGTLFCLIVRSDGTRVYSDHAYNNLFSQFRRRGLRGINPLIESAALSNDDKDRILHALANEETLMLPFDMGVAEAESRKLETGIAPEQPSHYGRVWLHIEPLERPHGYFVIRAVAPKEDGDYAALVESMPVGCYVADEKGTFLFINNTFAKQLGTHTDRLLASHITLHELVEAPENGLLCDPHQAHFSGNVTITLGKESRFHLHIEQKRMEDADRVLFCGVVSSPKSAMNSASQSEEGWDYVIARSPIPMALFNESGLILQSNEELRDLTFRETESPEPWNLFDGMEESCVKQVQHRIALLTGKEEREEDEEQTSVLHKPIEVVFQQEGDKHSSLLYITPLANDAASFVAYLVDTSEQKSLEQRFVQSQKMQAVGQLAGGIAHDFNNLLTAITGFCDLLLLRHPAGDQSFAEIMQIKQNSARAANLVRQLLAFSRKQTLQPQLINITDTLAELSNLIRRLIGENIELHIRHGDDIGVTKVDQGQFEQVIINLAVNARDAMTDGGILTIQTKNVTIKNNRSIGKNMVSPSQEEKIVPGDYIQIDVIDTGCGIPQEKLTDIFEPFFTTKELGAGTGLGLSTVYGIVNQTGGYIYVASQEGKGTKFTIFLQRTGQDAKPTVKDDREHREEFDGGDLTGNGTILLVEDEAPVRAFSAQALTSKGYHVLQAENGEMALDIIHDVKGQVDIIITDVVMPGISGPNMVEHVMKDYPGIKVIFISGYAEDVFGTTYGADRNFNFLPKPFTLKQLASRVKEALREREEAVV
jgi:two-component system cell cycle sensor histidine kinase/response regulator CckA